MVMTAQEQLLADDKMRAEIAKLFAETRNLKSDDKMRAEIGKLMAETAKINNENRWYIAVVASGATLATVAVAKLFL